ncbi:filamentation induced by cAMP protein Fic [Denitrovibrio acetiphilus DSM 12809]|jgi:Fic family protein|uniref:Filamentation induced by cAMP protein Fic n=1 Tax=Denitrovibrio acetiphilus (strain DSM 12809 / NBRC 114555 / N2460) TaxID=522772 RepID=D4H554_DENA2|nr:Fic family protein [Denitrovibrio acetiphilus]ADD69410.1 filamentation induced by cAMP protein Fic [Denitrovibrio acetiphilus DSM 12809]
MDKSKRIGRYVKGSVVGGKPYNAYIPNLLPPEPPIDMSEIYPLLDKATAAIGRLDSMNMVFQDTARFLYMYVRREAVLSSQIEGTQSSLSDLLTFENDELPSVSIDDVAEVSSYVSAMYYGLEKLSEFPLSLRLIKEIHEKLMTNSRGSTKQLGEFRKSQNWVGGLHPSVAKFVPPPPESLMECLDNFEKYLHDEKNVMPVLIKAAIAHVQFETIHPFLDGNGRLGRLLITFILCIEGLLKEPLLYLSLYFKINKEEYYKHLQNVRLTGDWESWIKFFLQGVIETSQEAIDKAKRITLVIEKDRASIYESGKSNASVIAVHNYMQNHPMTNTAKIKEACGISLPTVIRSLAMLESLGIVKETTGKQRHKIFAYAEYISILNEGTE